MPSLGQRLEGYAALVRVPNLFTAPPDVILGAALAAGAGGAVSVEVVAGVALASVALYAAGTALNDYVDAPEDATLRPERPIPSGQVSRRMALALGVVLLGTGVLLAAIVGGVTAGVVAGVLATAIVLYDAVFKDSPVGALVMGSTRGFNVVLGIAAVAAPTDLPTASQAIPVVVALYIAAVTYMAESESGGRDRLAVPVAIAAVAVATVAGLLSVLVRSPPTTEAGIAVALLVGFVTWTGRVLRRAAANPSPKTIGPAVGTCVLGLVVLDAAFAAPAGAEWSLAALVFLVPAIGLGRIFDVT